MILLKAQSLKARSSFQPESMSLNIEERNSSASITMGPEAPEVKIGDWLQDDTEPGKGIVWRVKSVSEEFGTGTRTASLEHVIQALKDQVMFGEVTPATITGNKKATSCTAKQAVVYILGKQSDWTLQSIDLNPTNPYAFNGDTLFSALETVTGSLKDCQWEYDFSAYPFKLKIRQLPETVTGEMRMSRNITKARRQIDRSRMYTRIYPIGENNLHVTGDYIRNAESEKLYGVICKVETDQSQDTEAKLKAWAQERLDRHCVPTVTVTVDGLDLSRDTGESLDKITVGRKCRVPLPEYGGGITITEKVTKLSWSDKIKEPEKFTVTLANNLEDVASIINNMQNAASSGGRSGAKKNGKDHAWFVDTTEHVSMVAEAVSGEKVQNWDSFVSTIMVDGAGIHQQVLAAKGEAHSAMTRIDMDEEKIALVVEEKDGQNVIKSASIVTAINDSGSSVIIEADHIDLSGYVTAASLTTDWLNSLIGQISIIYGVTARFSGNISAGNIYLSASTTSIPDSTSLKYAVKNLKIENGNLYYQNYVNSNWNLVGAV